MRASGLIDEYTWEGGREAMLRFGPAAGPVVIAAPALFEEANRTRAFLVAILRALAERGVASVLPDLPGQGESIVPTERATVMQWREAFARVAEQLHGEGREPFVAAIRGGAIVDTLALVAGRWHLSPMTGADMLRDLTRAKQAAAREDGGRFDPADIRGDADEPPLEIAGNLLSRALLRELQGISPFSGEETGALRVVRLDGDPRPAERKVTGPPLWRRSEPATDAALVAILADDIADWIARCAG